jgi:transposase
LAFVVNALVFRGVEDQFDGTGMILATKWLEEGSFAWPPIQEGTMRVTAAQLAMLVEGLSEWSRVVPKLVRRPTKVC